MRTSNVNCNACVTFDIIIYSSISYKNTCMLIQYFLNNSLLLKLKITSICSSIFDSTSFSIESPSNNNCGICKVDTWESGICVGVHSYPLGHVDLPELVSNTSLI